jgi:hypothetical protein
MRQCAAVCGNVQQCSSVRQYGSAAVCCNVCVWQWVRGSIAVCGSAAVFAWQCVRLCAAVPGSVWQCALLCAAVRSAYILHKKLMPPPRRTQVQLHYLRVQHSADIPVSHSFSDRWPRWYHWFPIDKRGKPSPECGLNYSDLVWGIREWG